MAFRLANLVRHFGGRSPVARLLVPQIAAQLPVSPDPQADSDSLRLFTALQSYYAAVILVVTAFRCGQPSHWEEIASGTFFQRHNLLNLADNRILLVTVNYDPLFEIAAQLDYKHCPPDPLGKLYRSLFPATMRHEYGEYYTPDWLVEHVLKRAGYDGSQSLLDPACGSGAFLTHAVRQSGADWERTCQQIAGIDRNPLACLSARANLILLLGKPQQPVTIPIYCADSILDTLPIGPFDIVAGNPPWVNWETLQPEYRQQTRPLWDAYGLFPHRGMDMILGKGKKDLAVLMTLVSADRYLRDNGILSFILTETVLKSSAAAGFRKLRFGDTSLRLLHVDDLSGIHIFKGARTHTVILTLQKGAATAYPVPYTLWNASTRLQDGDSLAQAAKKTAQHQLLAEPIGAEGSPLAAAKRGALDALHRFRGVSPYQAHAGVYTGGANAVYWLEVLADDGHLATVHNLVEGAKRAVNQIEALIESDLIYPLLRSGDVSRWQAFPSAAILMVQDVETRQGYDPRWLQAHYPHTYNWLLQFEAMLRSRAAFRRYFRSGNPFYSMFDVGSYSFSPFKVIWQGMGAHTMQAAVSEPFNGKPVMSNQAVQPFVAVQHSEEAHYLAACLNNPLFDFAVICHGQAGGKSFAQPGILQHLYIPQYDAANPLHGRLAALSLQAHAGNIPEDDLLQAAAALWKLRDREVTDVLDSLTIWQ